MKVIIFIDFITLAISKITLRYTTLSLSLEAFECFSSPTSVHFPVQPISSSPWAQLQTHRSVHPPKLVSRVFGKAAWKKKGSSTLHDLAASAIADNFNAKQRCLSAPVSWWQQHSKLCYTLLLLVPVCVHVCMCSALICWCVFTQVWLLVQLNKFTPCPRSLTSNETHRWATG